MTKARLSIALASYGLASFFVYTILRFELLFRLGLNQDASDEFGFARVFFSGPMLVIIGVFLAIKFRSLNRLFGVVFALGGIVWIFVIVQAIIAEAA